MPDVPTLERTPHAMTVQGLMSSQSGHFDKQDQKRLDQDWMTGFDNRDRLAHLLQQKERLALDYQALEAQKTQILTTQRQAQEQRQLWMALQALRREDLNTTAADAQLQHKTQQLQALLRPESDTAQAQKRWDEAQAQTRAVEAQLRDLQTAQTQDDTLRAAAQKKHSAYLARSAGAAVIEADFAADFAARLLATARDQLQHLQALLMDRATFDAHGHLAVAEPVHAAEPGSDRLRPGEAALGQHLRTLNKGRLEQEFLPAEAVHLAVRAWTDKV